MIKCKQIFYINFCLDPLTSNLDLAILPYVRTRNNTRKEFTMTKTMNEQQFIKFYMNLKRSGKSEKEIERIITKWQTEGDDEGVKLVLV